MGEISQKLSNLRKLMKEHDIVGLRLKGIDWFHWATGGGTNAVLLAAEFGVAEILVTEDRAFVLTNRIERDRLTAEEIPSDFEVVSVPWEETKAIDLFIHSQLNGKSCFSDRPSDEERKIPYSFQVLKMILQPEEMERYKVVGRLAAEAMTDALGRARPDWTENQLAGEGAKELWSRGLDPALVMVGSHKRIQIHRHPIARSNSLGDAAMMVFCARGKGLYANLTRFVFFRNLSSQERDHFYKVAQVEAKIFDRTHEGQSFDALYGILAEAYHQIGHPEEIHQHHQGGPTGYLSREHIVSPQSPSYCQLKTGMAIAWNPSLPGAKIEDTILLGENGLEILTVDPRWPAFEVKGRKRPEVWVKS